MKRQRDFKTDSEFHKYFWDNEDDFTDEERKILEPEFKESLKNPRKVVSKQSEVEEEIYIESEKFNDKELDIEIDEDEIHDLEKPTKDNPKRVYSHSGRETAIFSTVPYFGMIPTELLKDPTIRPQPKTLFAVYHSYSHPKELTNNPAAFVSQKEIAEKSLGCSQNAVSKWAAELSNGGWATIIRLGQGRSNIIILHDRKGKKLSQRQKQFYIERVRALQARYHVRDN